MAAEITQKENRQRELDRAVAQSSVFREEEKLQRQKEALLQEQKKLIEGLQSLALDIRRESDRISHLCEDILALEGDRSLTPVQEAAETAKRRIPSLREPGSNYLPARFPF